jgi:hypothetical protein
MVCWIGTVNAVEETEDDRMEWRVEWEIKGEPSARGAGRKR